MHQIALDTNIAIDILNGDEGTIRVLSPYEEVYLPFTVCGELLFGAMNSKKSIQNVKKFKAFISNCIVLNSNTLVSEEYATIRLELKKKGQPIPENDIWIAAICRVNDIPLFTRDKHFEHVEGLNLEH